MGQLPPDGHEGVLQNVLGEARIAQDASGDPEQRVADLVHQIRECRLVARARPLDEVSVHGSPAIGRGRDDRGLPSMRVGRSGIVQGMREPPAARCAPGASIAGRGGQDGAAVVTGAGPPGSRCIVEKKLRHEPVGVVVAGARPLATWYIRLSTRRKAWMTLLPPVPKRAMAPACPSTVTVVDCPCQVVAGGLVLYACGPDVGIERRAGSDHNGPG